MYALLFADAGLTTGQISTLFVLWSVVSFTFEVPSGAWADTWSRRRLYALGAFLTAAGFGAWTLWPAYPGFALGFVLWGLGGALASGALEALVYDELVAAGAAGRYARIAGRSGTVAILAMLVATLLASPVYVWGGYPLVGALSVVVAATAGVIALGFTETPRAEEVDEYGGVSGYLATLRAGLREVRVSRRVGWAVLIAALVYGLSALDEYLPLVTRANGVPTELAPLLFALPALAMAVGSAVAGRWARVGPVRLGLALALAAVLLAAGGFSGHVAGMLPVGVAFGLLQFAMVITETRLQEATPSAVRATVLSVSGFAAEIFAVLLYAFFGLGAGAAAVPVLFGLAGLPVLLAALAVALRLPPAGCCSRHPARRRPGCVAPGLRRTRSADLPPRRRRGPAAPRPLALRPDPATRARAHPGRRRSRRGTAVPSSAGLAAGDGRRDLRHRRRLVARPVPGRPGHRRSPRRPRPAASTFVTSSPAPATYALLPSSPPGDIAPQWALGLLLRARRSHRRLSRRPPATPPARDRPAAAARPGVHQQRRHVQRDRRPGRGRPAEVVAVGVRGPVRLRQPADHPLPGHHRVGGAPHHPDARQPASWRQERPPQPVPERPPRRPPRRRVRCRPGGWSTRWPPPPRPARAACRRPRCW